MKIFTFSRILATLLFHFYVRMCKVVEAREFMIQFRDGFKSDKILRIYIGNMGLVEMANDNGKS